MNVRNVVKVMNFHALIRVDNARRKAEKYRMMEAQLQRMMASILYNRNLILDKRLILPDENAPEINIYLGSDFGFCSNYNSQINDRLATDHNSRKILIGRKLHGRDDENVLFRTSCSDLEAEFGRIREILGDAIRGRSCSRINIIYNHYENTSTIYFQKTCIYPVETDQEAGFTEDFVMEGKPAELLRDLMAAYVNYELMLAVVSGRAAENVLRQNATTESLKKIDEMEEEHVRVERREKNNKEFQKVIDNYVKQRVSG